MQEHGNKHQAEWGIERKMNRNKILSTTMLLLLIFSALSLLRFNVVRVSAAPVSPYITVKPEKTSNSTYTVGSNYTVSLYTNYNVSLGSDLYMWQFCLTFNPSMLEGLQVINGNLISTAKHSSATFVPGTFDNTIGRLSMTYAYFYHANPPPFRTTGPGTLANVTFRVKDYGVSDIHISEAIADPAAILGGWNAAKPGGYYEIMDGTLEPEKLGDGYFRNTIPGDVNGDGTVNVADAASVSAHWYPGPPRGPLGYGREADINLDGIVDIGDAALVSANWNRVAP